MNRPLALALSGDGARGALQVGALRALLEAKIQPDLLVGTSIGAANAAALAIRGVATSSIASLVEDWRAATAADLLSSNTLRLMMRAMLTMQLIVPITVCATFSLPAACRPTCALETFAVCGSSWSLPT